MCGQPEGEAPRVVDARVKTLDRDSEEDKAPCEAFECGSDEWEVQVSRFITRNIWLPRKEPEHVLLAIDRASGDLVGFGAWKHTTVELPQQPEPVRIVRICFFGVASEYKGAVDNEGRRWASRLYSTVEAEARKDPETTLDMPFELYCDRRNERGLRFWTGAPRSYEVVGPGYAELLRLVRRPPGQ
jgi:ribosomal protein S18 acetylase RimI-like enzyme